MPNTTRKEEAPRGNYAQRYQERMAKYRKGDGYKSLQGDDSNVRDNAKINK
jgi:hypothetical protein